jgi:CheY-like chemotaxis protein
MQALISIVDDDRDFCDAVRSWTEWLLTKSPQKHIHLSGHSTGQQFFDFLDRLDLESSRKTVILLDLDFDGNKTAGLDALVRIRNSEVENIRTIPVVIYSNSDDITEISKCYHEFANSYVWKGNGFGEQKRRFLEVVKYWTEISMLPSDAEMIQ